jgi:hypothetical protein
LDYEEPYVLPPKPWKPPLQALSASTDARGEWQLEVDRAVVEACEEGIERSNISVSGYLDALVSEGRAVYCVGSELNPAAAQ